MHVVFVSEIEAESDVSALVKNYIYFRKKK